MTIKRKWKRLLSNPGAFARNAMAGHLGLGSDNTASIPNILRLSRKNLYAQSDAFRRSGKPTAILVGFSPWKVFMSSFLAHHNVVFLGHDASVDRAALDCIRVFPEAEIYCWSYKAPPALLPYCDEHGIAITYVEDGFLRGTGLGVNRTKPLSLVFDKKAMHFDKARVSELEALLNHYDFETDKILMQRAEELQRLLLSKKITKYFFGQSAELLPEAWIDPIKKDRILVLGQVEDDLSIRYGMEKAMSGNDLVRRAVAENPNAQILYRPHPETSVVAKAHYSKPQDVEDICTVLPGTLTLHQSFSLATKVYTLTSLAGFEATLVGLPVKVFGNPFYSGWGITEDVVPLERRSRKLTPLQVLAGAYLLYPKYFHPETNAEIDALAAATIVAQDNSLPMI